MIILRRNFKKLTKPIKNVRYYSNDLVDAFDNASDPQPLNQTSINGLFNFDNLTSPQSFGPLSELTIDYSNALVHRIVSAPSNGIDEIRKVVKNLDRLSDGLCRVIDLAELVRNVHPDTNWVTAADETYDKLCEYMNELNTHVGLYQVSDSNIHIYYLMLINRHYQKQ